MNQTQFFNGEMMHCELCHVEQQSNPDVNSEWRLFQINGTPYYVCPNHFPTDRASQFAFAQAYKKVLSKLRSIHRRKH